MPKIDTSRPNPNFIRGCQALANFLNLMPKQLYPQLAQNRMKGVKKINGRYVGCVPKMLEDFTGAVDECRQGDVTDVIELNGGA
jgi:hypothetical protein